MGVFRILGYILGGRVSDLSVVWTTRVTGISYSCRVASPELFTVQHQHDLPGQLAKWLAEGRKSVLERPWVVVPSAAMRQRLDWDLADVSGPAVRISSNVRFLFLEEFVGLVEQSVLEEMGKVRHDWRVEAIAGRLASLAEGNATWAELLAEAATLDEVVRWRPESVDSRTFAPLTTLLLQSDEWRVHGPLVQRARTMEGLAKGMGRLAPSVALYGLANAPGGGAFVSLVSALASRCRVGIFLPTATLASGLGWSRSMNEQLTLWRELVAPAVVVSSSNLRGDVASFNQLLTGDGEGPFVNDGTVRLLGSVGLARQVEMARDEILRLLETGDVSPHEILVTTPDLDAVQPHIERFWGFEKFSSDGVRLPRLPYEVIERPSVSFRSRDRLVGQLLALTGGYVTADEVDEVLAYPTMASALGLDEEHRGRLLTLAREGRIAFGVSAAQRRQLDIFPDRSEAGTWNRVLARLAMTAMMPDDRDDRDQLGTGDDIFSVGGVCRLFDAIEAAQSDVEEESVKTLAAWCDWVKARFGSFVARGKTKDASLERAFEQVRTDFPPDLEVRVDFDFFRNYWRSLSESGAKAQTFGRYGVHVAPLPALAMASYRSVVVIGLDEERLPSAQIQSPILSPARVGDPNPRAALLASLSLALRGAREGVVLCFNDRNEVNGEKTKRSVVLDELLDRIGGEDSDLLKRGARHGFALPNDRKVVQETFDPRYEGLATLIVGGPSAQHSDNHEVVEAAMSTPTRPLPEEISVKELRQFLRDSAGHFIERGLHGRVLPRVESSDFQPRTDVNGLITYQVRLEVIEHFAGLTSTLRAADAEEGYFEVLGRESVAAEVPLMFKELRKDRYLQDAAEQYKLDLSCFEPLTLQDEEQFYRPITLKSGVILRVRSTSSDEKNPWTVVNDYSARQADQPGAPATVRLYPNKLAAVREWQPSLEMLLDLLVMKVQQSPGDDRQPTATNFFAGASARSSNAQITYRFAGSGDQARDLLERLVALYVRGLDEPLALGRCTTPMMIEGAKVADGFAKDSKEPLFAALFGTSLRDFRNHPTAREVQRFFNDIASHVIKSRETGQDRRGKAGLRFDAGASSIYLPLVGFSSHASLAAKAARHVADAEKPATKAKTKGKKTGPGSSSASAANESTEATNE